MNWGGINAHRYGVDTTRTKKRVESAKLREYAQKSEKAGTKTPFVFFFLQKIIITNRREGGTNFKTAFFFVESNQFSVHGTAVAKVQSHHSCTQKTLAKCVTLKVLMEPGTEQEVILGENWLPAACFV